MFYIINGFNKSTAVEGGAWMGGTEQVGAKGAGRVHRAGRAPKGDTGAVHRA